MLGDDEMTNENDSSGAETGDLVLDVRYPARRVLALLADKWTPIVFYCLASGTRHFGQMHRRIPGLSKKMLTQVLRRLERDGVVTRRVLNAVPPKTDYELSALGRRLYEPVALICAWAEENEAVLNEIDLHRKHHSRGDESASET